jgi:hypothetical protein
MVVVADHSLLQYGAGGAFDPSDEAGTQST